MQSNVPRLFLLQINRAWHGNVHAAGASNNFRELVFCVMLHDQHRVPCYTRFCDHLQAFICNFTKDLRLEQRALAAVSNSGNQQRPLKCFRKPTVMMQWAGWGVLSGICISIVRYLQRVNWNSSGNPDVQFEHTPHCCEVRALAPDSWAEAASCQSLLGSLLTGPGLPNFHAKDHHWWRSSLVTRIGSAATTHRPNSGLRSRRARSV